MRKLLSRASSALLIPIVLLFSFLLFTNTILQAQTYDMSLVKNSISGGPIKYGVSIPFTIVVTNQSTAPVTGVEVIDYVPAGYTFDTAVAGNGIWASDGTVAGAYTTNIAGPIAVGGSATVTINLILEANSNPQNWINKAEIFTFRNTSGAIVTDTDSTPDKDPNNDVPSEDDFDTQTPRVYDLALIKKLLTPPPYCYFDTLEFETTVYNQGNETTGEVVITDFITEGYRFVPALNTPLGWVGNAPKPLAATTGLAPMDSVKFKIKLILLPEFFDGGAWDNYAEIFSIEDAGGTNQNNNEADSRPNSNTTAENAILPGSIGDDSITSRGLFYGEDQDDHDPAAPRIVDIALRKERASAVASFSYTQQVTFNVSVFNQGNTTINSYDIVDTLVCGLAFPPASNPGWTVISGENTVRLNVSTPLAPNSSRIHALTLDVNPCYAVDPEVGWDNFTEIENMTVLGTGSNIDIDGVLDRNFKNDLGGIVGDTTDNYIDGNGPKTNQDEDNHDVERVDVFDLALINRITTPMPYAFGQLLDFNVRIINQGNIVADSVEIRSFIPDGYEFDIAANTPLGWSLLPGDTLASLLYNNYIFPADTVDLWLKLRVRQSSGPLDWVNRTFIFSPRDTFGINRGDDADSFPYGENNAEKTALPGSPDDDNIEAIGPAGTNMVEDDHDVAGFFVTDLALTKTVITQPPYTYNQKLTYAIAVTNQGGITVNNYSITDFLPCGFTFIQADNAGWTFTAGNNTAQFTSNVPLMAGQTRTTNIVLTMVPCATPSSSSWSNRAEISAVTDSLGNTSDFDSTPDNNPGNDPEGEDDFDVELINITDLALTKVPVSPVGSKFGDVVTFNIVVANQGNTTITNYNLSEYIQCGWAFVPSSNPGWTLNTSSNIATFTEAVPLAPGASKTFVFRLTLAPCANITSASWSNAAEISSLTTSTGGTTDVDSTPDSVNGNDPANEDDHDSVVLPIADLSLTKTITNSQIFAIGSAANYNLTIRNEGSVSAFNVHVVDYLPCGLEFLPAANPGWTLVSPGVIRYTIPTVASAPVVLPLSLRVRVCVPAPSNYRNRAEISSMQTANGATLTDADSTPDTNPDNDPPSEDDSDEATIQVQPPFGTIGDFVFNDMNGDGVQSSGELGISGMIIKLYNDAGTLINTTMSGPNGSYLFNNVVPGSYYLVFMADTQYTPTTGNVGNDATDSDITGANGMNSTAIFTIAGGETNTTIDGGFFICTKICGMVWYDDNKNDINDIIENGINGIKVELYKRVGASSVKIAEAFTGHKPGTGSDDGYFEFCTAPGTYYVKVIMPPYGLVQARPGIGGSANDSDLTNANGPGTTNSFTISTGNGRCDIKAGFYPMARIGNLVWLDENVNGRQDAGELPAQGVTVKLYDDNGTFINETNTSSAGRYEFDYLEKKEYYIQVMPPSGYSFTYSSAGDETMDSDIDHSNGLNTSARFMMQPDVNYINVDVGLAQGILPVTWLGITAKEVSDANTVEWQVADEMSLDRYEVMRWSESEKAFLSIGEVKPNETKDYIFDDRDIANHSVFRYMVRQYDFDGRYSHSNEVIVVRNADGQYKVYPNPTSDAIHIDVAEDTNYTYEIINSVGQTVENGQIHSRLSKVDVNDIPKGMYNIRVLQAGYIVYEKSILVVR